jgi:hypothetical protein
MPERDYHDLPTFIAQTRACAINTVVIAWQDEYGQVPDAEKVTYERIAHFSVLAYQRSDSLIMRYRQSGDRSVRAAVKQQLIAAGFSVEERTRNEVKYR